MKKLYFLMVVLFVVGRVNAQNPDDIVFIPDANFKAKLLQASVSNAIASTQNPTYYPAVIAWSSSSNSAVDANGDGEIQWSEAQTIKWLDIKSSGISNLTGIEAFTNLICLNTYNNQLTTLDVYGLVNLNMLNCSKNQLQSLLNVSVCTNLIQLSCIDNQLTSVDLYDLPHLKTLGCSENQLSSLDVSSLSSLYILVCYDNELTSLNLKNNNSVSWYSIMLDDNPLVYVCADEEDITYVQNVLNEEYLSTCNLNSYCSFTPGGVFYSINGNTRLDSNSNGCDVTDSIIPNQTFTATSNSISGSIISNGSGSYSIPVVAGSHSITPVLECPSYFNVSPATVSVTFPATTSPFTQNFCITPNGLYPDLEVAILPTTPARPGFDADYKIIIKNKGNIQQSGSVSLAYNDAVLDYVVANPAFTTQTTGSLTWSFANLEPFETREINVTLNVNSPMETPAVNGDDVLTYTATITSEAIDELPLDNTFALPQIVVNSFDPNDKTCLEGTSITPDMIGQYVHYMIRFENTGTFAAQNIVVKDMIDVTKFDVSSLVALNGSHPYVTRITGNKVEFIFENINLPFDDANNDGYVVFKIKTLPSLVLGNSFSNTASIYFDFNHPIVTEPAVTTFAELGTEDFEFNNYFTLYPNPTSSVLNITSKQAIEMQNISIYNVLGQMVVSVPNAKGISSIDVSSLPTGNYFIKVVSDKGTSTSKFIRQ